LSPAKYSTDNSRLGIVGVHDVRAQSLEHVTQLAGGTDISPNINRAAKRTDRNMRYPRGFESLDHWTGTRSGHNIKPRAGEGAKLRLEQPAKAHCRGGHMKDARFELKRVTHWCCRLYR